MAQVPVAPQVTPSGPFIRPQQIDVNADMFGGAVGRGLSALGEGVARYGTLLEANKTKMQDEADRAGGLEGFMGAAVAMDQLDAQFKTLNGANAAAAYPKYMQDVEAIRKQYRDSLATPGAKAAFEDAIRAQMLSHIGSGASHAAQQHKVYVDEQSKGRISLILNDSQTKFNDDGLFAANQTAGAREIADQGRKQGWSAEQTAAAWVDFRSKSWKARLLGYANADPQTAFRMFGQYKDNMTPEDFIQVDNVIRDRLQSGGVGPLVAQGINGSGDLPRNGIVSAISGGADVSHLSGSAQNLLAGIRARSGVPTIVLTSGYRSPGHNAAVGGAKASQHVHGNALDISLVGMNDQQKAAVLQAAIASGARGIGIYKGGRSLHVDTRASPALWGMSPAGSYKGHGTNLAPAWAQPALGQLFAGGGPRFKGVPGGIAGGVSGAPLYQRLAGQLIGPESGGRVGVVSPKGAMGLMQVMPDTGRMVAAQLGIPWNPQRMLQDPQYNFLIGSTYLQTLLSRYGGNEVLAVAAYNAGPGRVDGWLRSIGDPRTGMMSNEQWAANIPIDETRNYVAKVFGTAGPQPTFAPITGNSSVAEISAGRDRIAAMAADQVPGNAQFLNSALAEYDSQVSQMQKVETALQKENWQSLLDEVMGRETGVLLTSPEQLSAEGKDKLAALPAGGDFSYKSIMDQLTKQAKKDEVEGPPTTEQRAEYYRLKGIAESSPSEFDKLDLTKISPELPWTLQKQLMDLQRRTVKEKEQKARSMQQVVNLLSRDFITAGLAGAGNKKNRNAVAGALGELITMFVDQNKREPTDEELRSMFQGLVLQTTQPVTSMFGETPVLEQLGLTEFRQPVPVYGLEKDRIERFFQFEGQFDAVPIEVIPPADFRRLATDYQRKYNKKPTDTQVRWLYQQEVIAAGSE